MDPIGLNMVNQRHPTQVRCTRDPSLFDLLQESHQFRRSTGQLLVPQGKIQGRGEPSAPTAASVLTSVFETLGALDRMEDNKAASQVHFDAMAEAAMTVAAMTMLDTAGASGTNENHFEICTKTNSSEHEGHKEGQQEKLS